MRSPPGWGAWCHLPLFEDVSAGGTLRSLASLQKGGLGSEAQMMGSAKVSRAWGHDVPARGGASGRHPLLAEDVCPHVFCRGRRVLSGKGEKSAVLTWAGVEAFLQQVKPDEEVHGAS